MDWLLAAFTAIGATIVGAAMLAAGGWSVYHAVRLTFWWPRASAKIMRYWITRSEDKPHGQRFSHPVLKFKTADGLPVVAISSWGSWRRPWPVRRLVCMHYNPTNPRWAEIRGFANVWGMPLIFVGLTAIFGLVMWFRLRQLAVTAGKTHDNSPPLWADQRKAYNLFIGDRPPCSA